MANRWNAQWQFIKNELEKCPDDYWKIVFIHRHQVFVERKANLFKINYNYYAPYFVPLFDQYGVDFVFMGHAHYYANLDWKYTEDSLLYKNQDQPLTENLPPKKKLIHYIISGAGGNELRRNPPLTSEDVDVEGFHYRENSSQFLIVKVDNNRITVESKYADTGNTMHERVYTKY